MQTRQQVRTAIESLSNLSTQELMEIVKKLPDETLDHLARLCEVELIERDDTWLDEADSFDDSDSDSLTGL